jgi:phosphoglycolate phosphatase
MKFRAIIFDLDGTLLNTIDDLADSMNYALGNMGFEGHSPESYKYFVGDGVANLVKRALPENARDNKDTVDKLINLMRNEYSRRWDNKTIPYEGIPSLLDNLENKGITINVLSNKPDDFTVKVVSKLLGKWNFNMVIGAREGVPVKPDPTLALQIADGLGIPAEEILYVGDTNTDMQTANRAGMFPLGVAWGFRDRDELIENGARKVVDSPSGIWEFIND